MSLHACNYYLSSTMLASYYTCWWLDHSLQLCICTHCSFFFDMVFKLWIAVYIDRTWKTKIFHTILIVCIVGNHYSSVALNCPPTHSCRLRHWCQVLCHVHNQILLLAEDKILKIVENVELVILQYDFKWCILITNMNLKKLMQTRI